MDVIHSSNLVPQIRTHSCVSSVAFTQDAELSNDGDKLYVGKRSRT